MIRGHGNLRRLRVATFLPLPPADVKLPRLRASRFGEVRRD
jgi:hypothetical protein